MKGRIGRADDIWRTLGYQNELKRTTIARDPLDILATNCSFSREALALEFDAVRALRPEIKRPYAKISLSLPAGERLSRTHWSRVLYFVLEDLGLSTRRHQFVSRRHRHNRFDHCHTTVNRIAMDGSVWVGQWEAFRFIEACQRAERFFGLKLTPGLRGKPSNVPHDQWPRTAEHDSIIRAQRTALRNGRRVQDMQRLREKLEACAERALDLDHFQKLALLMDVEVMLVNDPTWQVAGVRVRECGASESFSLSHVTLGSKNMRLLALRFEGNEAAKTSDRPVANGDDTPESEVERSASESQLEQVYDGTEDDDDQQEGRDFERDV